MTTIEDEFRCFVLLVRDMREAQKQYFSTRTQGHLHISKNIEAKVDRAVREITMPQEQKQGKLQ